jgi:2-dehydropantoate 2-reductase
VRPSIAILGPGGVGGLLAAALTRAGASVTVVAREATAERIARAWPTPPTR